MNASSKSKLLSPNVFFALLPFLVYVITAVLRKLEIISSRNDTILVCNAILFLFAVGAFFVAGLPSKSEKDSRLWGLLANLAFPLAAFLMNTSVFGLFIRREVLLDDLWNWHFGWMFCAALQILLLTGLGSGLLTQIQAVLAWGKNLVSLLGTAVTGMLATMNGASESAKLTVFAGVVAWALYTGIQIYSQGLSNVFNADFIWTSTWLWLAVIVVSILIHLVKPVCEKTKESVQNGSTTKLWIAIGALAFIAIAGFLPSILQTLATLLLLPTVVTGVVLFAAKQVLKRIRSKQPRKLEGGILDPADAFLLNVEIRDLKILLVCAIGVPLFLLIIATLATPEGKEVVQSQDMAAWLDFIEKAVEVSGELLDLLM